ncbi:selenocysteine-specific translation elongation factor [Tissierella creatinophila]|uniref:Selenocysteine-specific elongation factor n=1 Tax=Tissierella creatinophila DSM 6911 TaxID=1123403 RepID=A0A1U7M7S4_TISCR|nr:selenocysteine-specific translation elongation factor [Tissierella creatinophila]OLS03347.1 selenocysteine-specific elongation factor [Tissierella creatinophila DSM 6911]
MKHIIIGTAGHIDHGKTTLIRAITGRNTDRLKEEQKRGISIELGFTYFDLPNGERAGIIDVPGHEKFIKNMLAGVIGIDIVMLVVAADEGPMPQTLEHLAILDLLGIKKGFIVITKTDLVDEDWLELVEEEIREKVEGTFLEDASFIKVSSTKGEGIEEVIEKVMEYSNEIEEKKDTDLAYFPIDRSFVMPGFGTVVTGTLLSGKISVGDEIEIFPEEIVGRVRTLQVHDKDQNDAYAGQRVAMNIAGVKKEEASRGSVIAPIGTLKKTMMLDVKIKLLKSLDRSIANRTRVRLYIGTKEILCRLILLDRDELNPGDETFAQLRLEEEIVAKRKDRFIIRFYSPMFTIGGGEVVETNPSKHKRFDKSLVSELEVKSQGSQEEVLEQVILDKSPEFPSLKELVSYTAIVEDVLKEKIDELISKEKIMKFTLTKDIYILHLDYFENLKENIEEELKKFHSKYPLKTGMSKEEIRSKFLKYAPPKLGEGIIDRLIKLDYLKQDKEYIRLKDFNIKLNENQKNIQTQIINLMKKNNYNPLKREEMIVELDIKKDDFYEVFNYLVNIEEIIKLNEDIYLYIEDLNLAIDKLIDFIKKNNSISIAEFRDVLNSNRKTSLLLLEYADQLKITLRNEDKRILYKID